MVLSAKVVSHHVFFSLFFSLFHTFMVNSLRSCRGKVSYPKLRVTFKTHIPWAGLE